MTDLEMTKLCAEAMDIDVVEHDGVEYTDGSRGEPKMVTRNSANYAYIGDCSIYDPIHDDAQAMALMRRFALAVWGADYAAGSWKWRAESQIPDDKKHELGHGVTPNRAIVECVAKMQKAKHDADSAG